MTINNANANNLDELKSQVETIAQKIIDLKKCNPVNKDAITTSVKELLDAKRLYAQSNNGIGVDGKPWEEPMTKSQKKAKAKNEGASSSGNGNGNSNSNGKEVS